MRIRLRACLLLVLSLTAGCDASQPHLTDSRPEIPNVAEYVTGEAARQLTREGRFRIENGPLPTEAPTISAERAGEQALAFVRTFAEFRYREWERRRGALIDFARLEVDPRIFLARTPYRPIPPGPFYPAYRHWYGPSYMVRLVSDGETVFLVSVSAFNADVRVEGGRLDLETEEGHGFAEQVMPVDMPRVYPVSPESAVRYVGTRLGARVTRAPELVRRGHDSDWSPVDPLWKLSLDREVVVWGTRRSFKRAVRTLYVGYGHRLFIPAPTQPRSEQVYFMTGPPWPGPSVQVEVPVKPGEVVRHEEVVPSWFSSAMLGDLERRLPHGTVR